MSEIGTSARTVAGWILLWLAAAALVSCASSSSGEPGPGTPSPLPTLPTLAPPPPTETPIAAHATANTLMLTAVSLENRGALGQAIQVAGTALIVATSQPADQRVAASFLTRAPARATNTAEQDRVAALTATVISENPDRPLTGALTR